MERQALSQEPNLLICTGMVQNLLIYLLCFFFSHGYSPCILLGIQKKKLQILKMLALPPIVLAQLHIDSVWMCEMDSLLQLQCTSCHELIHCRRICKNKSACYISVAIALQRLNVES